MLSLGALALLTSLGSNGAAWGAAFEVLPPAPPIPADNLLSPAKIKLGKELFFDPRLSINGTISCNSCHSVQGGGVDNQQFSSGVGGAKGGRNAPTVWNAAFLSVQFWDGRARSLEEQAKGPMINPVEMGNPDHGSVVARLKNIPGYVREFSEVFGSPDTLTIDNAVRAIASYERTLLTPNAPVDRFLLGDASALSPSARRGMDRVQAIGCTSCHNGPSYAGPAAAEGLGNYRKFPRVTGTEFEIKYDLATDLGRFQVTGNPSDRNMWRVPSWRNVALTAPYFHNGSVKTLDEAVRVMAKTQLGLTLEEGDVADIVAFLEGLTGQHDVQTVPVLPF